MTRHTPHQGLWNADPARTRDEALRRRSWNQTPSSPAALRALWKAFRVSCQASPVRGFRNNEVLGGPRGSASRTVRTRFVRTTCLPHRPRTGGPEGRRPVAGGGGVDPAPAGPDPLLSVASLFALSLRGRADLPDHARVGDLEERTVTVAHEP